MHAVRRTLAIAAATGLLVLTPTLTTSAYAEEATPPTATAEEPGAPAESGCAENPVICESSGPLAPPSEIDCNLPANEPDEGIAVGEPNPSAPDEPVSNEPKSDTGTATISAEEEPAPAEPAPDGQTFCIASTVGIPEADTTSAGGGAAAPGVAPPGQLPRTGPAPLLPTVAVGSWLVLLGVVLALAGRRRTAAI